MFSPSVVLKIPPPPLSLEDQLTSEVGIDNPSHARERNRDDGSINLATETSETSRKKSELSTIVF